MALAGVASANTEKVVITPLTDTTHWSHESLKSKTTWTLDDGILSFSSTTASGDGAVSTYTFENALSASSTTPLTFEFDITRGSKTAGVSLALVGNTSAVVVSTKDYGSGDVFTYNTTNTNATGYYLTGNNWNGEGMCKPSTYNNLLTSGLNYNATLTIKGNATLDNDGNTILTLTVTSTTASSSATKTYNLGQDFELNKIMFGADNNSTGTNIWKVSKANISGAAIPEPATATLSLLALAGLCARRRRK